MPVVRWSRSELAQIAAAPKVRWGRSELSGTVPTTPKVRWGRSEMTGTISISLPSLPNQTVEPETTVSLGPISPTGGETPDFYTWRQISGPAVTLIGSGNSRTFLAPSFMVNNVPTSAVVVIGVTATLSGSTSVEQTCTITVNVQTDWMFFGGVWNGEKPVVML